jgi:hypothetical protein
MTALSGERGRHTPKPDRWVRCRSGLGSLSPSSIRAILARTAAAQRTRWEVGHGSAP